MQTYIDSHLSNIYSVVRFLKSKDSSQTCKSAITHDTLKCVCVSAIYSMIMRWALGRVHYTKYLKWGSMGAIGGLAYSFYFTAQKANVLEIRK